MSTSFRRKGRHQRTHLLDSDAFVAVVLCHIPRARIPEYSRFVTEQFIAQPPRSFLNVTSNEVEMTLIADADSMQDLAEFVHEDTDRIRRSAGQDPRAMVSEAVELSEEPWSVLIVDTKEPPKGPVTFGNSQSFRPGSCPGG